MTVSIQQARVPIGYVDVNGKKLPVMIDRTWYQYLMVEVFNRIGGHSSELVTVKELIGTQMMMAGDDGGSDEWFFIPAPAQSQQIQQQNTTIIWDETSHDEPIIFR